MPRFTLIMSCQEGGFEVECRERFREGWGGGKLVLSDGEIITEV